MTERTEYANGELCWVDLAPRDQAKAKAFYGGLFGWTTEDVDTRGGPPYALFRHDGALVAAVGQLSQEMIDADVPSTWVSYVNVADAEATSRAAVEAGGTVTVPVTPVMDAGRLAFIAGPCGATIGLWERGAHFGAERVNEPGAFCWNELATRTPATTLAFYERVFGWTATPVEAPSPYWLLENEGRRNAGVIEMNEAWAGIQPHWGVYFAVADADATVARAREIGGANPVPPFDTAAGRMAVLIDDQGTTFSVVRLP
ncbi:MAG: VOC family protein [Sandaracinaceae bacterium]